MITAVISGIIYMLGFAFSYCLLVMDKCPEAKAFLISIFWLPIMIVRIIIFMFMVLFPKWYNNLVTVLKKLSI